MVAEQASLVTPLLEPLVSDLIQPALTQLSFLVGGIFGLYVLLVVVRIYYERRKVNILEDIRYTLNQANLAHHIKTSRSRPTFWRKVKKHFKKE